MLLRPNKLYASLLISAIALTMSFAEIAHSYSKKDTPSTTQSKAHNTLVNIDPLHEIKRDLRAQLREQYPEEVVKWLEDNNLAERVLKRAQSQPELLKQVAEVRNHVNLKGSEKFINLLLAIAVAKSSR